VNDLQRQIIMVMQSYGNPMMTVYKVCHKLGNPQQSSTNKYYVRVYRNMEKLVKSGDIWVMRGIRDPSVYLSKAVVKAHQDKSEIQEIPF